MLSVSNVCSLYNLPNSALRVAFKRVPLSIDHAKLLEKRGWIRHQLYSS